jgi:transcriptional regulator with GAF, ATPase, and Fis domain
LSKRKKGASGEVITGSRKGAKPATVDRKEENTEIKFEYPATSQQAAGFHESVDSKLSFLRKVAIELLEAVVSLRTSRASCGNRQVNLRDEVRKFETAIIRAALVRTHGNQWHAARLLGVKPTTLNAKIRRYGISSTWPKVIK